MERWTPRAHPSSSQRRRRKRQWLGDSIQRTLSLRPLFYNTTNPSDNNGAGRRSYYDDIIAVLCRLQKATGHASEHAAHHYPSYLVSAQNIVCWYLLLSTEWPYKCVRRFWLLANCTDGRGFTAVRLFFSASVCLRPLVHSEILRTGGD